jgi:hypothetical protein
MHTRIVTTSLTNALAMALLPQLLTHFIDSRVISLDSDLSAVTHEKCSHNFATMTVELQRMISRWSLSGKGDEDLDKYGAGEDEDLNVSESLKHCSQGKLDSCANFWGLPSHTFCTCGST